METVGAAQSAAEMKRPEVRVCKARVIYVMQALVFVELQTDSDETADEETLLRENSSRMVDSAREMFGRTSGIIDVTQAFPGAASAHVAIQGAETAEEDGGQGLLSAIEPHMVILERQ